MCVREGVGKVSWIHEDVDLWRDVYLKYTDMYICMAENVYLPGVSWKVLFCGTNDTFFYFTNKLLFFIHFMAQKTITKTITILYKYIQKGQVRGLYKQCKIDDFLYLHSPELYNT